jgi:hypothetical protein
MASPVFALSTPFTFALCFFSISFLLFWPQTEHMSSNSVQFSYTHQRKILHCNQSLIICFNFTLVYPLSFCVKYRDSGSKKIAASHSQLFQNSCHLSQSSGIDDHIDYLKKSKVTFNGVEHRVQKRCLIIP